MPGYFVEGDLHFISFITGPSRLHLGVRFSREPAVPIVAVRRVVRPGPHDALDPEEIRAAVTKGLASASEKGRGEIHAAEAVFLEDSSPRYDMFAYAAYRLALHYLEGGEFEPMPDGLREPTEADAPVHR